MTAYAARSLRLYLANRTYVLGVPILTLGLMVFVSILIAVVLGIANGFPLSPEIQQGFRSNMGAVWCLPGFLMSVGVLAATRNFAMALAFGTTRRHFWLGTTAGFVVSSAVTAVSSLIFLAVEQLTGHWFIKAYAFDVVALGNGNYLTTFVVTFVLSLLSLTAGALFGTVFRAFGPKATTGLAFGCVLLLFIVIALAMWQRDAVGAWLMAWGVWAGVAVGSGLVVVTGAASYAACRAATV